MNFSMNSPVKAIVTGTSSQVVPTGYKRCTTLQTARPKKHHIATWSEIDSLTFLVGAVSIPPKLDKPWVVRWMTVLLCVKY